MAEAIVEFVGGPPVPVGWRRRSRRLIAGLALSFLLAAALLAGGLLVLTQGEAGLGLISAAAGEPAATRAFAQALHHLDPVGMRAQVTATCLNDAKSSLCFGSDSDTQFRIAMRGHTLNLTFVRRYQAFAGTVVLYDLVVTDQSTGKQDDLVLILRLARNGKIDHALVS